MSAAREGWPPPAVCAGPAAGVGWGGVRCGGGGGYMLVSGKGCWVGGWVGVGERKGLGRGREGGREGGWVGGVRAYLCAAQAWQFVSG
jgi:hypothetical protein